jgi:hypothetical protein
MDKRELLEQQLRLYALREDQFKMMGKLVGANISMGLNEITQDIIDLYDQTIKTEEVLFELEAQTPELLGGGKKFITTIKITNKNLHEFLKYKTQNSSSMENILYMYLTFSPKFVSDYEEWEISKKRGELNEGNKAGNRE